MMKLKKNEPKLNLSLIQILSCAQIANFYSDSFIFCIFYYSYFINKHLKNLKTKNCNFGLNRTI